MILILDVALAEIYGALTDAIEVRLAGKNGWRNTSLLSLTAQLFSLLLLLLTVAVGIGFVYLLLQKPATAVVAVFITGLVGASVIAVRALKNWMEDRRVGKELGQTRACPNCTRICSVHTTICPRCESDLGNR